jgi:hypothetical protein
MYSIGLRYCGGCNPQIDRARAVTNLQEGLKKRDMPVECTTDRERKVDLALLVNGCMHACLEEAYLKEGGNTRFISIKGEMVDSAYVREDRIPEIVINKIVELYHLPPSH